MERENCIRCGGTMVSMGEQLLRKGNPGWHWRGNLEHESGESSLPVEMWCCTSCQHLDFYLAERSAPGPGSGIAQARCPFCGQLHEMDDPKCPHCGKRLY